MVYLVTELQCEEGPSDFLRAAYMGFRGADSHVTKLVRSLSARISKTLLVLYLGQCAVRYKFRGETRCKRYTVYPTPKKPRIILNNISRSTCICQLDHRNIPVCSWNSRPECFLPTR